MMKKRIHQIELFQKYPYEVQTELMGSLINKAAKTVYGQKFGFSNIRSVSDFQKQLPIQNYQDLFPYIDRIMHGEKNVLWPTEIKWFAKSSGTTNSLPTAPRYSTPTPSTPAKSPYSTPTPPPDPQTHDNSLQT